MHAAWAQRLKFCIALLCQVLVELSSQMHAATSFCRLLTWPTVYDLCFPATMTRTKHYLSTFKGTFWPFNLSKVLKPNEMVLPKLVAWSAQTQTWLKRTQEKLTEANRAASEAERRAGAANNLALQADKLADAAAQRRALAEEAQQRANTLPDTIKVRSLKATRCDTNTNHTVGQLLMLLYVAKTLTSCQSHV